MTPPPTPQTHDETRLGSAVRSAMMWNTVSMVLSQVAMSGIFLLLASRLTPHAFGIFGLAAVFVDFFNMQGSTACVDAIVRRQDFSRKTLSTAFYVAMTLILVITAALVFGAGVMAEQLKEPSLTPVLAGLALTLLPLPFTIGPYAIMRQKLDFKGIAVRGIIASLAGGGAAVGVAFTPWAEWSLVVQRAVTTVVAAVIIIGNTRSFPRFEFDFPVAREFLSAVGRIFTAQGVCGAVPRLIDLLVAMFFGAVILGCLRVATKLVEVIVSALVNPIGQMVVVLISKSGEALDQRRTIFLQLSKLTALLCLPGFAGVALVSHEFTRLALAPDYAPVAPMLMVLCVLNLLIPVTNFRNSLLTSLNRLNMLVWFAVIDLAFVTVAMLLAKQFGYIAVLVASGAPTVTSIIFAIPFVLRQMNTNWREFLGSLAPPYVATAAMAIAVVAFGVFVPISDPLMALAAKAGVGAATYIVLLFLFFRRWSLDVVTALRNRQTVAVA